MNRKRNYTGILLLAPGVLLLLIFFLVPMFELFRISFLKYDPIHLYLPQLTIENYQKFFSDPYFSIMILNSLKIGSFTMFFALIIGYPVAYYFTKIRGLERTILSAVCLLPIFVTILVTTLGWYILLLPFGMVQKILSSVGLLQGKLTWLQSFTSLVIVEVHLQLPYVILILASSIQNVSEEKVNAAKILGASMPRILQKILIPLTMPAIISSAILTFALSISSYLVPILITGQKLRFLPMAIFSYTADLLNWPFASAIAILLLTIVTVATYLFTMLVNRLTGRGKWEEA